MSRPRRRPPRGRQPLRIDTYDRVVTTDDKRAGVLRTPASPVTKFDSKVREVCQRMAFLVKHDPNSLGLAAPQVNSGRRIIALRIENGAVVVVVNPEIEIVGDSTARSYEGCFSVPLQRVEIERAMEVILTGLDMRGDPLEPMHLNAMFARAAQHEIDHLNGILITDHGEPESVRPGALLTTGEAANTSESVKRLSEMGIEIIEEHVRDSVRDSLLPDRE